MSAGKLTNSRWANLLILKLKLFKDSFSRFLETNDRAIRNVKGKNKFWGLLEKGYHSLPNISQNYNQVLTNLETIFILIFPSYFKVLVNCFINIEWHAGRNICSQGPPEELHVKSLYYFFSIIKDRFSHSDNNLKIYLVTWGIIQNYKLGIEHIKGGEEKTEILPSTSIFFHYILIFSLMTYALTCLLAYGKQSVKVSSILL